MAVEELLCEIEKCRNCEACRALVESSCLVFPEIFRLVDREREKGVKASNSDLLHLTQLCTFCAACPCVDIRSALLAAKTEFIGVRGPSLGIRVLENVERIGKVGSLAPGLANSILSQAAARALLEKAVGLHRSCRLPSFPEQSLPRWMRNRKDVDLSQARRKVVYFAGCSARYLFPEVGRAVVSLLERNGVQVAFPDQRCCGMPAMLEGHRALALEYAQFNAARLHKAVKDGYSIVCSCPTCGYMLKRILPAGAFPSEERPGQEGRLQGFEKIPVHGIFGRSEQDHSLLVPNNLHRAILEDRGYFSSIQPEQRTLIARHTYDVGEYLLMLLEQGEMHVGPGRGTTRAVYYHPCHAREQRMGSPYYDLLTRIQDLSVELISGDYCCGNGGIMGFKKDFFPSSLKIAGRLVARVRQHSPEIVITDCFSCRTRFNQLLPCTVVHPVELVNDSNARYHEGLHREVALEYRSG